MENIQCEECQKYKAQLDKMREFLAMTRVEKWIQEGNMNDAIENMLTGIDYLHENFTHLSTRIRMH